MNNDSRYNVDLDANLSDEEATIGTTCLMRTNSELLPMTDIPANINDSLSVAGSMGKMENPESLWYNSRALKSKASYNGLAQLATIDVMHAVPRSTERPRKTNIICTIGPQTNSPQAIADLRKAGMNILRLNFSHGSHEYHRSVIDNLHKSYELFDGPLIAVALDTKGPEIRTGLTVGNANYTLLEQTIVTITTNPAFENQCTESMIYMDYLNLPKVVKAGGLIFIDDGLIKLNVVEIVSETEIRARVVNRGTLSSRKGVNLPGANVDLPSVSERDIRDLKWGVENNIDFVFASFIRNSRSIAEIREVLGAAGQRIQIIAKIENQQGIEEFDDILQLTDGVMVARGDLGIEIPVEKVFLAQKMIIAKCNILGKPVICATQMLESMTSNPRPTRAEVSDVANAVLDGADCVMLSGETAKGIYPCESVAMMHIICKEAESVMTTNAHFRSISDVHPEMFQTSETLASAAVNASFSRRLKAILVFSISGRTARLVSKYRPSCPIICVTTDPITARHATISHGVYPVLVNETYDATRESWLEYTERQLEQAVISCKTGPIKLLQDGDTCVVIQGWAGGVGHSNTMRLVTV